ncbi:Tetratricopeptide repeat-containing protein [Prevotella sp. ne3005]|nr:tetratricopeptide repeat protein [Prevotella sp. ne3005]SEN13755.1 Tetratricopeptide repeat-containing protein [Prevotella sp. ne3005]
MKHRKWYIGLIAATIALAMVSCSTQKNTAQSRWWHSFNARYNTYFNGSQAFIEGNLEKEKGNKDNYTELIPLYTVGNKQSRDIGKGQFDRTIEKCEKAIHQHSIKAKPEWNSSKRKTAKDREWLGRREYNPFLWKAWLLLGKAQFQKGAFDEAAATFSYMSRLYHTQPLMNGLARAWLAKCYTELGWKYDAEDVIRNMSRDSMDFRAVKDWDYTYANYYIRLGDYQKAIPYLRKVIKHERRSIQRAREWFLMGQIQNLVGNREEAYRAFGKVIGCHPPYELEFNARIAQTEVAASSDSRQMISKLRRMAASDNNAEYLDQVYYAIGNIHMTRRDTTEAIRAYEKGNRLSTRNGIEKGVLLLTLGNIYWEKEQFADAQRCYGEAIGLLDKERPDYEALSNRSKILDELVPYTNTIHLQDSLLALATMPEAERNKAIDRVIDALKKKEKEERDAQLEQEAAAAANASQAARADNNRAVTPTMPSAGNGQWYFYNPTAVSQGKATFQRQWGKRENIDNWQRINQTVISLKGDTPEDQQDQEDPETAMDQERPLSPADSIAADPHERDYYLAQIPFTAEQQAECHTLLQEALFRAGIILKDKMDHLRLSEQYLRRLTSDYPGYEHADEAWYHLYLLYLRQGNHLQANNCISHLKAEHPESEWTILLTDPYYAENAKFGEHIEDSLYSATYEAFKQDRTDMVKANASLSAKRFPQGANRAKFLFIDGMSRLNDGDGDGCLELLREVVEKYPDSEVSPLAGMIIKGVQDGRRLHGGKFDIGDVWTMRDITLTHDSTVVDTLSTERNQQYLFLLVYEPDSVNENQLLFEMARYNFTNFLVRNFEIQIDEDNGLHRMIISGFLSFDEAMQYARQLYGNNQMKEKLASCRSLIISEANLQLIGRQFSYDEYQQFYEQEFAPMRISKEQLLLIPEDMEQPDIEDTLENPATPENPEETIPPAQQPRQKQPVKDFDFGDDFW